MLKNDWIYLNEFFCRYLAARGYANGRTREGSTSGPHSDDDGASDDDVEDSLASPPHQHTSEWVHTPLYAYAPEAVVMEVLCSNTNFVIEVP